jgi:hypothetical protein
MFSVRYNQTTALVGSGASISMRRNVWSVSFWLVLLYSHVRRYQHFGR